MANTSAMRRLLVAALGRADLLVDEVWCVVDLDPFPGPEEVARGLAAARVSSVSWRWRWSSLREGS